MMVSKLKSDLWECSYCGRKHLRFPYKCPERLIQESKKECDD